MAERFTAEQAMDASERGEPIMVSREWLYKQCNERGAAIYDVLADLGERDEYDAADVLGWLGY